MARLVTSPVRRRSGRAEPPPVRIPRRPVRDTSPVADVVAAIDEVLDEE
ncbi:MAG TPA: hypothetical protein VKP64_10005 [Mycobacteriales bacterium]|nr:hypothetical protein [Mycobacteriales bacterium]